MGCSMPCCMGCSMLPCHLLSPRVCTNSCPLIWWCYLSNPLRPPFSFAFKLSQHQGLFQCGSTSYRLAKVLELQLQHQSFQWIFRIDFVSFSSVAQLCSTLCDPISHSTPRLPVHHQLLESTQTHVHWVSDAIQPSYPLSSPSPPALNLSQYQALFKLVSSLHQVSKYWSFSFNISSPNKHPGLISFRMDWLDLLAVQGTLKSLLQCHN